MSRASCATGCAAPAGLGARSAEVSADAALGVLTAGGCSISDMTRAENHLLEAPVGTWRRHSRRNKHMTQQQGASAENSTADGDKQELDWPDAQA